MPPRLPMLDPGKMPTYMTLSALAALAIGILVYRLSHDGTLAVLVGVFLVISDYLALNWLLDDEEDGSD